MSKILLTRGLPASGKSTWARDWVGEVPGRVRVNRDDIRFQLYGSYWGDGVDEFVVNKVEEAMVMAAVVAGNAVVVDATHLAARYVKRWINLGYQVELVEFPLPVAEAVLRDSMRAEAGGRQVGADVIRRMAKRYHVPDDGALPSIALDATPQWTPATRGARGMPPAYIVDIDGTVANHSGIRSPYDTTKYHLDTPHADVIATIWNLRGSGNKIIFVSGRDEAFRQVTEEWLAFHTGMSAPLFMRPEGDTRNDAIVKHELYHKHIDGKYEVVGVLDDRGRVLRMWRAIGLTTFAVGDTDNYNF